MLEPVEPVQAPEEPAPEGNEPSAARKAWLGRNLHEEDLYFKRHTIFRENGRKWDKFHEVQAKLRERILSTVASQKKTSLRTIYSIRQWLTNLQNTTALPTETIRQNIQTEYQKLMGSAFLDWPSGGPTNWLGKWQKLINQANRYDKPLRTWLRDVCLVWERVSDLTVFFANVKDKMQENNANDYTHTTISAKIQYY
ncbi:hypothetical protein MMC07_001306 [Pseudocyphellaria aurata]|nr:hypothetical protein [Pseudocyphellaria aurata]